MTSTYQYKGFGALSEWNGQMSSADAFAQYAAIAGTGANVISISPRLWTADGTSNTVGAHQDKTESDASLIAGVNAAKAAGIDVILRPHVTGLDGTASYYLAPSDTQAFFASYKEQIVHYATIAQQTGVPVFSIGNELGSLVRAEHQSEWLDIIAAVRSVYNGQLTYSAAMNEAKYVSFWSQLDTIGVNAYASLSNVSDPTVAELKAAWNEVAVNDYWAEVMDNKSPVDFIKSLSETYGKQVLLTEVGYRSIDGGATDPGEWYRDAPSDVTDQTNAYQAFLETWTAEGGSWLQGYNFWSWELDGRTDATGYSIIGKPAEQLVKQYFSGAGATYGLNIDGSATNDLIDVGFGDDRIHAGLGDDIIRAGAGDDLIVAGPAAVERLETTTVTFKAFGTAAGGEQAQIQLRINGELVGTAITLKGASDVTDYQTYTVTFANPEEIGSLEFDLINASPGRAAFFKGIFVNGYELSTSDVSNASAPGTFQLYVNTIRLDGASHGELFYGAGSDNDLIEGGAGDDTIDGGAGVDTAVYSGSYADYRVAFKGDSLTVSDGVAGRDGVDTLSGVERLQFADQIVSVQDLRALATPVVTSTTWSWGREVKAVYADGRALNTAYDHAGAVLKTNAIAADGSRQFTQYHITGKDYVSLVIDYAVSGAAESMVQYRTDGSVYSTTVYAAGGAKVTDIYDVSGAVSEHAAVAANGASVTSTYVGGAMTRHVEIDASGDKHLSLYGVTGKLYDTQTLHYASDGTLLSTAQNNLDGTKALWLFTENADSTHGYDVINSYVSIAIDQATTGAVKLAGSASIDATGNAFGNVIIGNAGSNIIAGGLGADTLTGGAGADVFVFNTALGVGNVDRITDFKVGGDKIQLDSAIFTALSKGSLKADAFFVGAASHDATDRIIYDKQTGALFYDDDGVGAHSAQQFATIAAGLSNLTHNDFQVV